MVSARSVVVAAAAATMPLVAAQCDAEYECTLRTQDFTGAAYDLKPLCTSLPYMGPSDQLYPYQYTDSQNRTYVWNICGTSPQTCIPTWPVAYNQGSSIQLFNDGSPDPSANCSDITGAPAPCTQNCEVLGVGPAQLTLYNANDDFGGVNLTHPGVVSRPGASFECPQDKRTGYAGTRSSTLVVLCDPTTDFRMGWVAESAPCQYDIVMYSSYGCGCVPQCYGRNCGSDGCGGYCGGIGQKGKCPDSPVLQSCVSGVCCKPDCRGRTCGSDGCGGFCGTAGDGSCPGANQVCTKYQICAAMQQASPSPVARDVGPTYISSTTPADSIAAVLGGVASALVISGGIGYFHRVRQALSGAAQ